MYLIIADFAVPFQIWHQAPASVSAELIIDLHHYVLFYLIIILSVVCVVLYSSLTISRRPALIGWFTYWLWGQIVLFLALLPTMKGHFLHLIHWLLSYSLAWLGFLRYTFSKSRYDNKEYHFTLYRTHIIEIWFNWFARTCLRVMVYTGRWVGLLVASELILHLQALTELQNIRVEHVENEKPSWRFQYFSLMFPQIHVGDELFKEFGFFFVRFLYLAGGFFRLPHVLIFRRLVRRRRFYRRWTSRHSIILALRVRNYFRRILHSGPLELFWTILPSFILLSIAIPSLIVLYLLDEPAGYVLTTFKVIGHQWYWTYEIGDSSFSSFVTGGYSLPSTAVNFDSFMIPSSELYEGQLRLLEVDNALLVPVNVPI